MIDDGGPAARYDALIKSDALTPDPAQLDAVTALQDLHRQLHRYRPPQGNGGLLARLGLRRISSPPRGLYIHGGVGRGKSMLMDLFFDGARVERKRRIHFHAFMQEAHERIHAWRRSSRGTGATEPIVPTAAALADRNWLLCFDEFEIHDIADAMIVSRLFDRMFELGVVVVATSNRHPDELYRDGLQRDRFLPFIDILKTRLDVLHLADGVDYRLERLRRMNVYHVPSGPGSDAALDLAFADLTDNRPGQSETIAFRGRNIVVPVACGHVARFHFSDLCEAPLGPGDFLAIARHYRTVIVAGIPVLSRERRDAARRFIIMIDTFYDNHIHLVVSADARPRNLYSGTDWGFEFERTVSRLEEMQSTAWIEAARLDAGRDRGGIERPAECE